MIGLPLLAATALLPAPASVTVTDIDGARWRVPVRDRPTCLIFVATDCPIANRMTPELRRIVADFPQVAFLFAYPDHGAKPAAIRKHRAAFDLKAPAVSDARFVLARFAQAKVTPEAVLYDAQGRRAYRGRINDLFTEHNVTLEQPTRNDLREALRAVLDGNPVAEPVLPAVGCPIPYPVPKRGT